MKPETDAREKTGEEKPPEPTYTQIIISQNEHIIKTLEGIFWALGGPMIANVHRTTYNALIAEQQKAKQKAGMEKKIVTAAQMPIPPVDFTQPQK